MTLNEPTYRGTYITATGAGDDVQLGVLLKLPDLRLIVHIYGARGLMQQDAVAHLTLDEAVKLRDQLCQLLDEPVDVVCASPVAEMRAR